MFDLRHCLGYLLVKCLLFVLLRMLFPTLGNENQSLHLCVILLRMSFQTLGHKNRPPRSYVVCLNIYEKLFIDCNFVAPMDANGSVGDGSTIASIKYSAILIADS